MVELVISWSEERSVRDGVRTYEAAGVRQLLHDLEVRWVRQGVQALRVEEVPGDAVQCEAVEEHLSDVQLSVRGGMQRLDDIHVDILACAWCFRYLAHERVGMILDDRCDVGFHDMHLGVPICEALLDVCMLRDHIRSRYKRYS